MGIQTLRILGIDPGLANTGWGVVDMRGYDLYGAGSGSIRTPSSASLAVRLKTIHDTLIEIVREYRPQVVSIEKLFFAQNVKTAMVVAQARGVAILATTQNGAQLAEYTPLQIKQAVAGKGRATKTQVQKMVRVLVRLDEAPTTDHAADALAAAICHANFAKTDATYQ